MASGLADYYRGIRPRYGTALRGKGEVEVTPLDWTTLILIEGKGMLYGGYLYFDYSSTQKDSLVKLSFDEHHIVSKSFGILDRYGLTKPGAFAISLLTYDEVNFIYSVGFGYGFTFELELELKYFEAYGVTPTVYYNLVYALI